MSRDGSTRRRMSSKSKVMAAVTASAAIALVGCGGNGDAGDEAAEMRGDPEAGREIFTMQADPACATCHTLEDAGATGTTAPNLDELQPSFEQVVNAVRTGPDIMPSYSNQLSDDEIEDVAAYVSEATR
jgi:cytochrome c6